MMKKFNYLLISIALTSCGHSLPFEKHYKEIIVLSGVTHNKVIIYQTERANFHFEHSDVVNYCKKLENVGYTSEGAKIVVNYLNNISEYPLLINDSNGIIGDYRTGNTDVIAVTPALLEVMAWLTLDLVKEGNVKIQSNYTGLFLDSVLWDSVETNTYGGTNIQILNDSIIYSRLRWIQ